MANSKLLKIGVIGTVISALCCFTPILVLLLGVLGLSSIVGLIDYVLLPTLALFLLMTGYALWKRQRSVSR